MEDDDFTSEVYREAFREMGLLWQKSGNVFPAELVSHFEEPDKQRLITEIFATQIPMDEGFDLQKAVTEAVKWMKRTKIDRMTAQASSAEDLQKLVEAKRKLDALHITI